VNKDTSWKWVFRFRWYS